jgi:ubiquinone/menaquinone biosynthesis C-methylase UbiE
MSQDQKASSQARFSKYAAGYAKDDVFFKSDDLARLVQVASPQPGMVVLDVATGGGATALKIAPHVAHVVATDYAPAMLEAARERVSPEAPNISFADADAENLPFPDASFDMVTCRIAAHHFPDQFRFVQEAARVLKPGGVFALQDLVTPDDEKAARYIDAFERLRDPSHGKMAAEYEWRGMCADAGLAVEHTEIQRRRTTMIDWAVRQGCDEATMMHLTVMMAQAPALVREWLDMCCVGSDEAAFDHVYLILRAVRPS